jgi:hypothetical protein
MGDFPYVPSFSSIEGMYVVSAIGKTPTDRNDRPLKPVRINSATIPENNDP